jgi:hypothetical protein
MGRPQSEETRAKISAALKGKTKGRRQPDWLVQKRSAAVRKGAYFDCEVCGRSFWRQPSAIKKGQNKYCSRECYQESQRGKPKVFSISRSGEGNPAWKGGIAVESQKERRTREYRGWRESVLARDGRKCQSCGSEKDLHAHHIESFISRKDLRFSLDNGLTLCRECHYKEHSNG